MSIENPSRRSAIEMDGKVFVCDVATITMIRFGCTNPMKNLQFFLVASAIGYDDFICVADLYVTCVLKSKSCGLNVLHTSFIFILLYTHWYP